MQNQTVQVMFLILISTIGILLVTCIIKQNKNRQKIKNLVAELSRAHSQLTEQNKQKNEFLSIASHQFRTPLTAIKGYSSMLLEGSFGDMSDTVRNAVDRVYQSSEHLVSVIDDFLDVSRIELGRMQYNFSIVDFRALVLDAIATKKPSMNTSGLTFNILIDEAGDFSATIDSEKMQQVILNLIENSIKYTPKGMVTISLKRTGEQLHLTIKDTGVGVAKEEQAVLFKKFSRARGKQFANISGSGLGLYIAKEILDEHNGTIWVESEGVGLGSAFHLEIPHGKNQKLLDKNKKYPAI